MIHCDAGFELIVVAVLIAMIMAVSIRADAETIRLDNTELSAVFDAETGALMSLVDKATGWNIQDRHELGLSFEMLVPVPGRRDNVVVGTKQRFRSYDVDASGKRITFTWDNVASEHGGKHDITMIGTVALSDKGLSFSTEVINNSPYVIETISYPCIGDLKRPESADKLSVRYPWYNGMWERSVFPKFDNLEGYWGTHYPMFQIRNQNSVYMLIETGTQGLYVASLDHTIQNMVSYTFELIPGYESGVIRTAPKEDTIGGMPVHVQLSVVHFPFVNPNESIKLAPVVMRPYSGTWHKGVDYYKEWKQTWYVPPRSPDWANDIHSWQQLHVNSPEEEAFVPYNRLVEYGEACARNGVKAIQLTGWEIGGQDRGDPSHDIEPLMGTWQELYDAIKQVQDMGVKIVLFTKFIWGDRSTDWFREEGIRYAMKDPYGDPYIHVGYKYQTTTQLADINTRRFSPMCFMDSEYRKVACDEFRKVLKLEPDGMLFDEYIHHGPAFYCFDPNHDHHLPAHVYAGDHLLAEEFRAISDPVNADFLYAGEAVFEPLCTYYSLAYTRLNESHTEVYRYVDPYRPLMAAVYGFDDREIINKCLLCRYIMSYEPYNFKGRVDDFPLSLEYGNKVDDFRRRYREYVWDAEYRSTFGASVTAAKGADFDYSVYKNPDSGKRAVIVVNNNREKSVEVTVAIDNAARSLVYASPENSNARTTDGTVEIPARSAIVVMEK